MAADPACSGPSDDQETPLVRTGRLWLALLHLVAEKGLPHVQVKMSPIGAAVPTLLRMGCVGTSILWRRGPLSSSAHAAGDKNLMPHNT